MFYYNEHGELKIKDEEKLNNQLSKWEFKHYKQVDTEHKIIKKVIEIYKNQYNLLYILARLKMFYWKFEDDEQFYCRLEEKIKNGDFDINNL